MVALVHSNQTNQKNINDEQSLTIKLYLQAKRNCINKNLSYNCNKMIN